MLGLLRVGLTAAGFATMLVATGSAESRIDLENQVGIVIPVKYPSTTVWITVDQLRAVGVDRFAFRALTLNRDMNELLDSIHRERPSSWIKRRLVRARPAFSLASDDKRTLSDVFRDVRRFGPCPDAVFSTHYSYVVRPVVIRGIERNSPDLLFPNVFRFALHGEGVAYPHTKTRTAPAFDAELTYAPDGVNKITQ